MSLTLPFTPEFTGAAIKHALEALADPSRQALLRDFDDLRLRVAENIAALGLRRYLVEQSIPHEQRPAASFAEADYFDLAIGGRRCIPVVQLVTPGQEPPGDVYIPSRKDGIRYKETDLYLFILLYAAVNRSREEIDRTMFAGKPVCLLHAMPEVWSRPEEWSGLGELALKADTPEPLGLTLYGKDSHRETLVQSVDLSPRRRQTVPEEYFSIGGIQTVTMPTGPVGVSGGAREEVHIISPHRWGNIRLYGELLVSAGYLPVSAFRLMARKIEGADAAMFHPCYHRQSLLTVPAASLRPLEDLFDRARQWKRG